MRGVRGCPNLSSNYSRSLISGYIKSAVSVRVYEIIKRKNNRVREIKAARRALTKMWKRGVWLVQASRRGDLLTYSLSNQIFGRAQCFMCRRSGRAAAAAWLGKGDKTSLECAVVFSDENASLWSKHFFAFNQAERRCLFCSCSLNKFRIE